MSFPDVMVLPPCTTTNGLKHNNIDRRVMNNYEQSKNEWVNIIEDFKSQNKSYHAVRACFLNVGSCVQKTSGWKGLLFFHSSRSHQTDAAQMDFSDGSRVIVITTIILFFSSCRHFSMHIHRLTSLKNPRQSCGVLRYVLPAVHELFFGRFDGARKNN